MDMGGMVMEDKDIIKLFFERSELALEEIGKKYSNYCNKIAYGILRNQEDVEECVNDSYFKVWESIPPNRPDLLSVFLGKIVRNTSLNKLKYYNTQKRSSGQIDLVLSEIEGIVSGVEDVESEVDKNILEDHINSFLRDESKENRVMFVKRYWYLKSISEIADECNVSESKVKSSLFRTRNRLKTYLTKEGVEI